MQSLPRSQSFEIITADGLTLCGEQWSPAQPRAGLLLVHGIGEHRQRYGNLVEALLARDIAVMAFDLRGHGRSEGERVYVTSFDEYLADLDLVLAMATTRMESLPLFLMGHSMGGTIATLYAIEHPEAPSRLRGLIVSSAAIVLGDEVPGLLQSLSHLIGCVLPHLPTIKLDSAGLSRDPEVALAYDADPLVNHKGTPARTGAELIDAMKRIQAGVGHITLPLLIRHGDADTLCAPEGSRLLFDGVASVDKTLHVYPGAYHELHNDLGHQENLADLADWIASHT